MTDSINLGRDGALTLFSCSETSWQVLHDAMIAGGFDISDIPGETTMIAALSTAVSAVCSGKDADYKAKHLGDDTWQLSRVDVTGRGVTGRADYQPVLIISVREREDGVTVFHRKLPEGAAPDEAKGIADEIMAAARHARAYLSGNALHSWLVRLVKSRYCSVMLARGAYWIPANCLNAFSKLSEILPPTVNIALFPTVADQAAAAALVMEGITESVTKQTASVFEKLCDPAVSVRSLKTLADHLAAETERVKAYLGLGDQVEQLKLRLDEAAAAVESATILAEATQKTA